MSDKWKEMREILMDLDQRPGGLCADQAKVAALLAERDEQADRIAQLQEALDLNNGLLRHTSERLSQAEAVIDHARCVLGNHVSLPPVIWGNHPMPQGGDFRMSVSPSMMSMTDEHHCMTLELKFRQMREMVCALEEKSSNGALHFYVLLDSGKVAYAIDRDAFAQLSEDQLAETLRGPISKDLSRLLANYLKGKHGS